MTKTEIERLATLEEKTDNIQSDVSELKNSVKDLSTKFDQFGDKLDTKYAAKWVQGAVSFVIGLIVAGFIGTLLVIAWPKPTTINQTTPTGATEIKTQ